MCFGEEEYIAGPLTEEDTCSTRCCHWYRKNRILSVFLTVTLVAILLGVIFIALWFTVLKRGSHGSTAAASHFMRDRAFNT